jgi:nicotinamidase-related amidase
MKKNGRHKKMIILFSVIGIFILFIAITVLTSLYVNNPTKGEPIAKYENPKSALLVVDVQNDTINNKAYSDTSGFIERVNQAVEYAEENGMIIIYIKNEYGFNPIISILSMGRYRKGTNGAELASDLSVVNDNIFSKSIGDSFSTSDFENYLISNEIDTLYIVGADAAACVYSTAQGGINRNYNINIIKDAIITINDKTMDDMLKKYISDGIAVIDLMQFLN